MSEGAHPLSFFGRDATPSQCKLANTYNIIPSDACRSNEKKETATIAMDDRCDYRWMVSLYHKDSITNPEKILQVKMLNYMKQED